MKSNEEILKKQTRLCNIRSHFSSSERCFTASWVSCFSSLRRDLSSSPLLASFYHFDADAKQHDTGKTTSREAERGDTRGEHESEPETKNRFNKTWHDTEKWNKSEWERENKKDIDKREPVQQRLGGGGGGVLAFSSRWLRRCVWSANQRNVSPLISCLWRSITRLLHTGKPSAKELPPPGSVKIKVIN